MDINKELCFQQGKALGKKARKKYGINITMQHILDISIGRNQKDTLQDICNLAGICKVNTSALDEILTCEDCVEKDYLKAKIYFVNGFVHGKQKAES